tara:strand:- start:5327 stop:5752 length:426 start_codon:yes stop_codon:yes gene_type:complete
MSAINSVTAALGKDYKRLNGPDDFHDWFKTFSDLVFINGYDDLYNGNEELVEKPTMPTFAQPAERTLRVGRCRPRAVQRRRQECSVPYAHHHAGTAERNNRAIRERASALIHDQHLPSPITQAITGRIEEFLHNASLLEGL